jgi:hypothetical protein
LGSVARHECNQQGKVSEGFLRGSCPESGCWLSNVDFPLAARVALLLGVHLISGIVEPLGLPEVVGSQLVFVLST